ncbi:hypothetical protein [Rhizobium mulingense]|uniref:hypothetical protein n=1 Tax=Rhizobium mulingense TaxID=3031128 RepID=UPI002B478AEC|nr:hypothetical protein [Rhizobium sp. MJ21]MEB3047483.1 hypothetical protein [Rhizobium sp. MJ21]
MPDRILLLEDEPFIALDLEGVSEEPGYDDVVAIVDPQLGISRIDRWLSMSHLKRKAVAEGGIEIENQIELPTDRVAAGAEVEISAKISAGYFTEPR